MSISVRLSKCEAAKHPKSNRAGIPPVDGESAGPDANLPSAYTLLGRPREDSLQEHKIQILVIAGKNQ